ncbi:alanine--tRNA ligase [Micromonospora endolithica]|uniref:Alanine--tRNA ligase n=1 Tax=Micromonospora endolithica TaxID=230091 RepID=A0A3A9ZLL2_9ACTN|nr:alanine--tRNA ligase [Micromonospora endolithica]RKN48217.1 alanine--tRNA ligase [Micromonospora endolithica]TWJ24744.1 alanyl-tRNA synthetase [Micromonospora endolithica]
MRSTDIRTTFFDFFTSRGHTRVPSSPLIPDDPTLLLANAGMNQFKPYFLGEVSPPYPRATSVQKCARTSDIDNVGRTTRHATFFEMLGNFSFGDYFKADAIAYAWELLTEHYRLDPGRLWITVYRDDDEAMDLWRRLGVPADRIQRLGMDDNFWSMGVPGPCGPSSEICYDRGPAFGPAGGPEANGERYLEIWNLVFMQNLRGEGDGKGDFPIVGELPNRSIDTGLGLDRIAAILQGVDTVCETDLLAPTLAAVESLAGRRFPGRDGSDASVSFQVVTEHARSTAFLIADGVLPSNEGRGYVLRRLMRRAIRHARALGIEVPVLTTVTGSVIDNLAADWPELEAQRSLIEAVTSREEEAFGTTLRQGTRLLDAAISRAHTSGTGRLPGETAFELHDTYGFPIDLTIEAAQAAGLAVDSDRYAALLDEQRRRAKNTGKGKTAAAMRRQDTYREILAQHGRTDFVGYTDTTADTQLLAILHDGQPVQEASEGQQIELVLDRSPFYAESGGQVGDTGTIHTADGTRIDITDTQYGLDGFQVLTGHIIKGEARPGQSAQATVDARRRAAVARSHSATHIVHAMLRRTLGDHARQQGSLVAPGRLRFDFTHFAPVDDNQLATISALVNDYLLDDPEVRIWHASRAEAEASGATAFFGDKYGERVRVVDIGDASRELCGGTHVGHGTQAGPVRILGESSIGTGLRRVEALTGRDALDHADHERRLLAEVGRLVNARPDEVIAALTKRLATLANAEQSLQQHRQRELDIIAERLAGQRRQTGRGWLISDLLDDLTAAELRPLTSNVLNRCPGDQFGVIIFVAITDGKVQLTSAITAALADKGVQARTVLTEAAKAIGGGAGGSGNLASAGGRQVENVDNAIRRATLAAEVLLSN